MITDRKTGGLLSIFRRGPTENIPAPWAPPELPVKAAPGSEKHHSEMIEPGPWMPPASSPKVSMAPVSENGDGATRRDPQPSEPSPAQNAGPASQTIIVQVAAPAPVYPYPVGWWAAPCPRWSCPLRAGLPCRRWLCW